MVKKLKILKPTAANVHRAAKMLQRGGVVAFPTETVYGLGANAFNEEAVCRVFEVKRRPSFDPLIVHVARVEDAVKLWSEVPPVAKILMQKFWPGPLSIILPKKKNVPDLVTSGLPAVAVRMPAHPVALALILKAGCPIAAPSANLFGYTSPTRALSVAEDLGDKIDAVLDGGASKVGVESTVIKIEKGTIYLLRPGGVTAEEIFKTTGKKVRMATQGKIQAPGQMKSHYAPRTPLIQMGEPPHLFFKKLKRLKENFHRQKIAWPKIGTILWEGQDLHQAASRLFQVIRNLDKMKPSLILTSPFPDRGIGKAINDRLEKASGGKKGWKIFRQNINPVKK